MNVPYQLTIQACIKDTCPECGTTHSQMLECPECGYIYYPGTKAEYAIYNSTFGSHRIDAFVEKHQVVPEWVN